MGDTTSFGPFELISHLDRAGPVSVLARAADHDRGAACLVEIFSHEFTADAGRLRAFDRLSRELAGSSSGGLLPVERSGVEEGRAYLVHPWHTGTTLSFLSDPGPEDTRPTYELTGHVVARICDCLVDVHRGARGGGLPAAHGNVVGERVLVGLDGKLQLAGACTAWPIHEAGAGDDLRLDVASSAPEILAGGAPTPASDVYQVGLVLYELLVGRPAFQGGSPEEIRERVSRGELLPPRSVSLTVPEELAACAVKALATAPAERYADASEMAEAMQKALRHHGLLAGRREVAQWAARALGDQAAGLEPPARVPKSRKRPSSAAPPVVSIAEAAGIARPHTDPSLDIELEGGVERDDSTMEVDVEDSGVVSIEPSQGSEPSVDLTLEGHLETEDVVLPEARAPEARPKASGPIAPASSLGAPPKAPPPKPQPRPPAPAPQVATAAASEEVQQRESADPSDLAKRAEATPAGLHRKAMSKLAASSWGRRVMTSLEMRRGRAPRRILFGDSTEFPGGRDYLVVISSAVEAVARSGAAEQTIHDSRESIERAKAELEVVDHELEALSSALSRTILKATDESKEAQAFGGLAERVKATALAAVAEARREQKARVDRSIAEAESKIARAKSDLYEAFGVFLATNPVELLGVKLSVDASTDDASGRVEFAAQQGIAYAYVIKGSQTRAFQKQRKVGEFVKGIELMVGMKKQFLRKDLVPDVIKMDDAILRKLEVDQDRMRLSLTSKHVDSPELFVIDFSLDEDEPPSVAYRPQGATGDPQPVSSPQTPEARSKLRELEAALLEAAQEAILVQSRRLMRLEVEGTPVVEEDLVFDLAHRVCVEIGPTVAEIAKRSPSPHELTLKIEDTGGVRQERYLEKQKLAAAFDALPEKWQDLRKVMHVV